MPNMTIAKGKIKIIVKGRWRDIGRYYTEDDNVVFEKASSDIFRKLNAFGFSAVAIKEINPDIIRVKFKGGNMVQASYGQVFEITKEEYIKYRIQNQYVGFELQDFIPVRHFKRVHNSEETPVMAERLPYKD